MPYDNRNRGSIWKNEDKETDTHPDFRGSLDVEGVAYWVSAWKRRPDANPKAPALSFSVKRKEDRPVKALDDPTFDENSDIPFLFDMRQCFVLRSEPRALWRAKRGKDEGLLRLWRDKSAF